MTRAGKHDLHDDGGCHAGEKGCQSDAGNVPVEDKDKHRIADNVDEVHDNADVHADSAVAKAPEDGSSCIVDRQERIRHRRDDKVGDGIIHYIVFNASEQNAKDRP
ncbi:MAG: hypothetical protein SOH60_06625 [Lachnospiraceae bacterium]|jgi:hypothetical protein